MIRKTDGGSTSGGRDSANVKVNTSRRRRQGQGPDSRLTINALLHKISYENSDEIALAIYRDITDTLKCNRGNEEYVERIRRELFLLCNYNRALTKAEGRFPRMHSLKNVLARYVELEYIVLYSKPYEGVKRSEREVEKRMRSILYMMLSNIQQQPVDHKFLHKCVLFVLQQVSKRYWAEERIVHKLNVHVFQKYGKFDAIVKIKDSREDFLIEHLRNNDPDIAYLSVDPFEDVRDFEPNIFIKIPEVNANKIYSFGPSVFTKTKCKKLEKVKSVEDEDVKQCGVILTIDLTSEAHGEENKTNNTLCSTEKQRSISDRCSEPDLSNKDLLNSSGQGVEETAVKSSTNDLSASCQNNDIIVISDSDVHDEESVPVPNAKADVIDLTSDNVQEVEERDDCVAQNKTSEDPAPVPVPICPPSPPRALPRSASVNQVNEISNNEPAPTIQHTRIRCVTINQVNEVSSSVISESDEVSRNEEVPANDGNVSSTGNSPSRNSVPYFNGEISSTTGKLDENALIELIYRKQSDFAESNFENSPSQSGTVYNKKFEGEKECGISSPTDERTSNLDLIETARVQNDHVVVRQHEEEPVISIDDTEDSTNDSCRSKQSESHLQIAENENERVAASCHRDEKVEREEHISQSVTEKECGENKGVHRDVHSTDGLGISIEAPTEQIKEAQQYAVEEHDANNPPQLLASAKSKKSAEDVQKQQYSYHNDIPSTNAELFNTDKSLIYEDTNNQPKSDDQTEAPEKTEETQIKNSDASETMTNHSECNSEANEDISIILEALINASTNDEAKNNESHSLKKISREEKDERKFSDTIVNEYNELVSCIDEYEKQITNHGLENTQNDVNEIKAPITRMQFKEGDNSLTENSRIESESNEVLTQAIKQNNDHMQLKCKLDDILNSSVVEVCVSHEPISKKQVEEKANIEKTQSDEHTLILTKQIEEENFLAENIHVEEKQSNVQAENEQVSDKPSLQKNSMEDEKGEAPSSNQLHVTHNHNEMELRSSLSEDEHTQVPQEDHLVCYEVEIVSESIAEDTSNIDGFNLEGFPGENKRRFKSGPPEKQADTNLNKKIDSDDLELLKNKNHCASNNSIELESNDFELSNNQSDSDLNIELDEPSFNTNTEQCEDSQPESDTHISNEAFSDLINFETGHLHTELKDSCELPPNNFFCEGNSLASSFAESNQFQKNTDHTKQNISESTSAYNVHTVVLSINKKDTENCDVIEENDNACEPEVINNEKSICVSLTVKESSENLSESSILDGAQEKRESALIKLAEINESPPVVNKPPNRTRQASLDSSTSSNSSFTTELSANDEAPINSVRRNSDPSVSATIGNFQITKTNDDAVSNDNSPIKSVQASLSSSVLTNTSLEGKISENVDVKTQSVLTNENLTTELYVNNTPIRNVQTNLDPSLLTNGNLATETNSSSQIKNVPTNLNPLVNLTTEPDVSKSPIKTVQTDLDPSVLTNENLTTEADVSNAPIKIVQTNLDLPVLTNANLTTETDVSNAPIFSVQSNLDPSILSNENLTTETLVTTVQANLDPSVLTSDNLTTETKVSNIPIKSIQTSLDPPVLTNEDLTTELHVSSIPDKTEQRNLDPSVLTNENLTTKTNFNNILVTNLASSILANENLITETNASNTPIKTVLTNLDSSVLTNEKLTTEIKVSNTLQADLMSPILTNENMITETNVTNAKIKTVQTNLDPLVLTNGNLTTETNLDPSSPISGNLTTEINDIKAPMKTVQTNLDPSILTNENLTVNVNDIPIKTVLTNLDPSVLTNENVTTEINVNNTLIKTVQAKDSAAETNEPSIQSISVNKKIEAETNENSDVTKEQPIKNVTPTVSTNHDFTARVQPDSFVIDEKQAADVLACYKNSGSFYVMDQHNYKPDDFLYPPNEEVVSEPPKEKSVPSELSVLIYNPDVNKNPLNLLATAAGTRPNLEVSPSKKLERSRVKMGRGSNPCNKGGKRQRSPKAASNMKTRTTPPRAAKTNAALNYCDKTKRFSIRSWIERSTKLNKTEEIIQQPSSQNTYNNDFNITNDESSDSFDGLVIAEDVELPETENPIDILDENTVDNELVLIRSESAVQISIPETEEYDHQILDDLEKIEAQKEQTVCKNLFGCEPSSFLNINKSSDMEDMPKKSKTTDHSIQSILNISSPRSKSNLDFTSYDAALDLSVGKCVPYEKSKADLVPYIFTDDGEILSPKCLHERVIEYNAESGERIQTKTKAEVKEYPFVCLSRHEVANYISSQTVPAQVPLTTRKKNLRSHAKFKNFKSKKRMSKENKRSRRGRGVKKTKLLSRQILDNKTREIKNLVVADRKYERRSKSTNQKESKPSKKESVISFYSQVEVEEFQEAITSTDTDKKSKMTDLLVGKDATTRSEKTERNKKTKKVSNEAEDEQGKDLAASVNDIEMTKSKKNIEFDNQKGPELKPKKNEVVRNTMRRRTIESKASEEDEAETKNKKNEMAKNTRSTERRRSVEVKRKEQENQLEIKPKKRGSEPENDEAFTENEIAVKPKKSETTKSIRKSVESKRCEPEVKPNRNEIVKREKCKGTEKDEAEKIKSRHIEKQKAVEEQPQISKIEKCKKIEVSEGERDINALQKTETKCKIKNARNFDKHNAEDSKQEEKEALKSEKHKKIEAESEKEEEDEKLKMKFKKNEPLKSTKKSKSEKEAVTTVIQLEIKTVGNKESEPEKSEVPSKKANEVLEVKSMNKIVKNNRRNKQELTTANKPEKKSETGNKEKQKDEEAISKKEIDKLKKNSKLTSSIEPKKKIAERRKTQENSEIEHGNGESNSVQKSEKLEVKSRSIKSSKRSELVASIGEVEKKSEIVKSTARFKIVESKENEQEKGEITSVKEPENLKARSKKDEAIKNEQDKDVCLVNESEQKDNCTERQKTIKSNEIVQEKIKENEKLETKLKENIENIKDIEKQKSVGSKGDEVEDTENCKSLENKEGEQNQIETISVNEMQSSQKIVNKEEEIEENKSKQDIVSVDDVNNITQARNCKEENKIEIEEKLLVENSEIEGETRNVDLKNECTQEIIPEGDEKTKSRKDTCDLIEQNELCRIKVVESAEMTKPPELEIGEDGKSVLDSTEDKHPPEKTKNKENNVLMKETTDYKDEENGKTRGSKNKEKDFVAMTQKETSNADVGAHVGTADTEIRKDLRKSKESLDQKNHVHLTQTPSNSEKEITKTSTNQIIDIDIPSGSKRKLPAEPVSEAPKKLKLSIEKLKQSLGDKLRVAETKRKDLIPKQIKHKLHKIEDIISNLKNKNESPQKVTPTELAHNKKSDGALTRESSETLQKDILDGAAIIHETPANRKSLLDGVAITAKEENKSEIVESLSSTVGADLKQERNNLPLDGSANDTESKQEENNIAQKPPHPSLHAESTNKPSIDGAVNLNSDTTETSVINPVTRQADAIALSFIQKSPRRSSSHTFTSDVETFAETSLDGAVNLDSNRTEAYVIDTTTKQADVSVLRSPSLAIQDDGASSSEGPVDSAVNSDDNIMETFVINTVTKQADVNIKYLEEKSPRHSLLHIVEGDRTSCYEAPVGGVVNFADNIMKTSVIDNVTNQADVNIKCLNQKSPYRSRLDTVEGDRTSSNEAPVDGAMNFDDNIMETSAIDTVTKQADVNLKCLKQKSPRHSPLHMLEGDRTSSNEASVDGAVNSDDNIMETSVIDTVTKQADVNIKCLKQKSLRHSPLHILEGDRTSSNEASVDGAVKSDDNIMETSVIDTVTKQADVNIKCLNKKSQRHSPLDTFESNGASSNEASVDGAVNSEDNKMETILNNTVAKQADVNIKCFNQKSPHHSSLDTVEDNRVSSNNAPVDGAVNFSDSIMEASVIDTVTKQGVVNMKCLDQKSPHHSPSYAVEGCEAFSNEAPVDVTVHFDDNVVETSVIDTVSKQADVNIKRFNEESPRHSALHVTTLETSELDDETKEGDHIADCVKQELQCYASLYVSAGGIESFSEMPLGVATNLLGDAMETSAIDAGVKEDDNNVICLNQQPPCHSPIFPSLDGAVYVEATKQNYHNGKGSPCSSTGGIKSLIELPLDDADANIMKASAYVDRNISVESMNNSNDDVTFVNRKLSIDEQSLDDIAKQRKLDPAVVLQYNIIHAESETPLDGAISIEQRDECLKEDLAAHGWPMDGGSVVKQSGLHQLREPSLDGATSADQKDRDASCPANEDAVSIHDVFSTERRYYPNEKSSCKPSICHVKQTDEEGLHHTHKQSLDVTFAGEEMYYQPNENSSHTPVVDSTSFAEQNSKSLFEPPLDGASEYPLEPEVENSLAHTELSPTKDISQTAGSTTEQKMEEILNRDGVFSAEDLSKATGNTDVVADVNEQGTKYNSQAKNADDVESCYNALSDVLLDNNQKRYLECCPKQHDEFTTEPLKLRVTQNMVEIATTDEVKVKDRSSQTTISRSMLDCEPKQKNSTFSLYTQEEINDNSIVNPPSVYVEAKKLDGKIIPATSASATQKITSIYTQEEINDCTTHPKKGDSLNPFGNKKLLLPLPNVNSLIHSAKEVFVKATTKRPSDFAYSSDFIDLPPHDAVKEIKPDFLYSEKTSRDFFEENKTTENIDNICGVENLNFLPPNMLHTDPIPMWRLGEVINENDDILTGNSSSQQSGVEFDDAIQEERSPSEGVWSEQEKQNRSDKVQGSHLQAFDNQIQGEGVDEIPSRKTLNSSGTIHIILEPSEHNYCIGGPLLNAKPKNNALKQVDTGSLSKMKNNEQVSDGSPVDGEHIFHFSEQISSLVKNNLSTLSMEDSPVDENNDDQDEQKIFSLIENSNTFSFSQPTVMSVEKMNDVMMAIANLNSLTSVQNKKLDKQKADFLFQQEDSISSNDSTVSNDVHSDCDFAINSIAMLRTQNTISDSVDDSDFPPHATDLFTTSPPSMNVIVKHNQSDFASIDSIFSGNDFDIIAQSKTTAAESNAQSQPKTTDMPEKQPVVVDNKLSKKRKPERDAEHIPQTNSKPSDGKLNSIQSNILDDMLVKAMQRQNTRTRVLAAQKKVHKEKNEVTSPKAIEINQEKIHKDKNEIITSRIIEITKQSQGNVQREIPQINKAIETTRQNPTITILNKTLNHPPLLLPKQDLPPNESKDDQPPVLTPEIQFTKFKPYEDSLGKTQHEIKIKTSRKDEVTFHQKPREDMIDSIKRRQRRPPEKYVDSVLLKVEKETQEEKFKVFEKNKVKSALPSLVKMKERKPKKRPAEDESSNDSSKSVKLRAKLIECSDFDENTSSEDFYKNKRRKKLKASELSDSSASDTDLEIKIRKERRMTSEERDALFFKVRDGKDCEEQKKQQAAKPQQQDADVQKQVRFNLQQQMKPSTETKQKKGNVQMKPQQDTGGQKQVRFNLQQHACPSTETKSEKYKQYKSASALEAPVKGYYTSSYGGHQGVRPRPDYRDRYMRVPNGGSQSSRYPSYPSQSSEQNYRSRSRSPLLKFGNSSERKSGFQDYRVYTNSKGTPHSNNRAHPGARNVDLPTLLSHYSQIHRASNSSTEWSKNVSGIGTPLPNVSFQPPPPSK